MVKRVKKSFWFMTIPIWPVIRMLQGRWRIQWREKDKHIKHIGWFRHDKSLWEFKRHLRRHGFRRFFMAYKDVDELFSMRKIHEERFQYHIRFYRDGRITGHYELMPELHTIQHLREVGLEPRREEFLEVMGEWIMQE